MTSSKAQNDILKTIFASYDELLIQWKYVSFMTIEFLFSGGGFSILQISWKRGQSYDEFYFKVAFWVHI